MNAHIHAHKDDRMEVVARVVPGLTGHPEPYSEVTITFGSNCISITGAPVEFLNKLRDQIDAVADDLAAAIEDFDRANDPSQCEYCDIPLEQTDRHVGCRKAHNAGV